MSTIATNVRNHMDARETVENSPMFVEAVDANGAVWDIRYNDEAGSYDDQWLCYRDGRGYGYTLVDLTYPISIREI